MSLGTRDSYVEKVWIVRELCRTIVHHAHDDRVALSPLILVHRTCDIHAQHLVDSLRLIFIGSNDTDAALIMKLWEHLLRDDVYLTLVEAPSGMIPLHGA